MRKIISKIAGLMLGLSMAAGVSVVALSSSDAISVHAATAATGDMSSDFSGTGGTASCSSVTKKTGYYQDTGTKNSSICTFQILGTSAWWTNTPTDITFTANLGGGNAKDPLDYPVEVQLLGSGGTTLGSKTTVTTSIDQKDSKAYSCSITAQNNVYGVKLTHMKEDGYNVRYYSFSLTYTPAGGGNTEVSTITTLTSSKNSLDLNGSSDSATLTASVTANSTAVSGATVSLNVSPAGIVNISQNGLTATVTPVKKGTATISASFAGLTVGTTDYLSSNSTDVQITVVDTTPEPEGDWVLTSLSDIVASDIIAIVGDNGSTYAMSNNNGTSSAPSAVAVTVSDGKITDGMSSELKWNVTGDATNGYTFYPNGDDSTWLYITNTNNGVRVGTGAGKAFTVEDGYLTATVTKQRYIGIYNSADWRCYENTTGNITGQSFSYYKFVSSEPEKEISSTRVNTSSGSITADYGSDSWNVSGFTFEVQYKGESEWNLVNAQYVVSEAVPTTLSSIGNYAVHFSVEYGGSTYHSGTSFTAQIVDKMTPISSFYDGSITVGTTATSDSYTYRGTVIAIEGNSYYLQDGQYGILVYGGNKSYATGMVVGDLVSVTSKIINYNSYVVESNSITYVDSDKTCKILDKGSLPVAPIVTTVSAFEACNQSTRVTFNGLSRNDSGETITWSNTWSQGSTHGVAIVKDSTGATTYLYVSKFLDSTTGSAIVSIINSIGVDDTFDVFQGVMAVNTNNSGTVHSAGTKHLSITSADQITIHTPESDPVQDWIDLYMHMNDSAFDGDGTGACKDSNYYINAKVALNAVETEHSGSKEAFQSESKYEDALARYLAWAKACGDTAPFSGTTIVKAANSNGYELNSSNSSSTIIIVVVALTSITSIGVLLVIKRKRSLVK